MKAIIWDILIVIIMFIPTILGFLFHASGWGILLVILLQIAFIILITKIIGKSFSGLKF